jgi:carbon storage regulator CsrA
VRSSKNELPRKGNLVLGRRQGETITLHTSDGDVTIRVKNINKEQVWLTLNAPKSINIVRSEIDARNRCETE